jgi:hypothetical protein
MTTVVSVAQGGTGSNSAALARTALGVPPSAAYDQANTARDQANTARTQANSAYSDANTRLSASGGTLAGDLIITGNLTVSGNSTTLNAEILTIEDADVVLLSNVASTPALNAGIIVNRGTSTNTFLRWDEVTDKWGWSDDGSTTYKFTSALDAYAQANSAYGAANNRVLKAGDTMTGQLNISAGGLLVTGNVGIGTTAPQSKLEVATSSGQFAHFGATSTASGQFTGITLGYRENNSSYRKAAIVQEQIGDNSARGHLHLLVDIANDTGSVVLGDSKLMIHGTTGNVGIGTSSPSYKLHIQEGGITAAAISTGWPAYNAESATQSKTILYLSAGNNGSVATAGQGGSAVLMLGEYFDSRGIITMLGAGGSSPSDVATGYGKDLMVKGGNSDNSNGYVGGRLFLAGGSGYSGGAFNANYGAVVLQPQGGNVGIGTTSPVLQLEITTVGSNVVGGNAISGSTMKGIKLNSSLNGDESVGLWFATNGVHLSGISGQRTSSATDWSTDLRFYTHEPATNDLTYTRERVRIDSGGRLLVSSRGYQPRFLVARSGNQTGYNATSTGDVVVNYNSAIENIGSHFNTATGKFTAPVAGMYIFQASAYSAGGTVFTQNWLVVNGSRLSYSDQVYTASGTTFVIVGMFMVYLNANDSVGWHAYNTTDTNQTITENVFHTWFKGYLIG